MTILDKTTVDDKALAWLQSEYSKVLGFWRVGPWAMVAYTAVVIVLDRIAVWVGF